MLFHSSPSFSLYFGDASDGINQDEYLSGLYGRNLLLNEHFSDLTQLMNPQQLLFLRQTHSIDGMLVRSGDNIPASFTHDGDFLITEIPGLALGVMTADCLPIMIYDSLHHVVAIIHAGWRGATKGIAAQAYKMLQQKFGAHPDYIQIFFGPSARACCYEVSQDFIVNLDPYSYGREAIIARNDKFFFDIILFNQRQFEDAGIRKEAFHDEYAACTMCDTAYASYRRQKGSARRQMSVVMLK